MTDPKQFTDVIYEVRDRAAWIIINRPKVYNAFRGQTLEELIQGDLAVATLPLPAHQVIGLVIVQRSCIDNKYPLRC